MPPSVLECALRILNTSDPWEKSDLTDACLKELRAGLQCYPAGEDCELDAPPDKPARSDVCVSVSAGKAPKRGRGGTIESRRAILHSLVHIENWAIDLSHDITARFAQPRRMPRQFVEDWFVVAADEARHFRMLEVRLRDLGSSYGAFSAHDGLWESAQRTSDSLEARLVIEHMVHEARGLDIIPQTIDRFRKNGDGETADLLEGVIYPEEVTHVACGLKWLAYLWVRDHSKKEASRVERACEDIADWAAFSAEAEAQEEGGILEIVERHFGQEAVGGVVELFHALVRSNFCGKLKPPFNHAARAKAGMTPDWYEPLAT